jgi:uncharacterized protein (TIGR03643 family)
MGLGAALSFSPMTKASPILTDAAISEIVEMALSDHTAFAAITLQHGVSADEVKAIMRRTLKPGSYRTWRKRVRDFSDRRGTYK